MGQSKLGGKDTEVNNMRTENQQLFKFVEEKEAAMKALELKIGDQTNEKESLVTENGQLKETIDKEKAINGLKEDEIAKLNFLVDEATSKLCKAQEEIVLVKDQSSELGKQLEVLNMEKNSITVDALS